MARGVWGLDISRTSIKAVRLERHKDSVQLTRVDILAYRGGTEAQPDEAALRDAVREVKRRNGIGSERVACTLPSHSTFNRLIRLPPVPEEQIGEIVKYEAQSQIPFPLDEVYWGYQPVMRDYGTGEEREVIIFACKRQIVEAFLKSVEDAHLNIDAIQFAPVALYNFLSYDQSPEAGTIVLDVGAENTDLILLDGARFWVRNIPITGNQFTKAIAAALKIKGGEAEKLKRRAGQTQQMGKIYAALTPVYQELTSEIHRSLGWYKSISRGSKFGNLLLLGNGSKTHNFQRFLAQSLSMPANRINRLVRIECGPRVDQGALTANLPSIGTALGLALQSMGVTPNRVNMLPPAYVRRRIIKSKEPMAILTAAVLLVSAFAATYLTGQRAASMEAAARELGDSTSGAVKVYNDQVTAMGTARQAIVPVQQALDSLNKLRFRRDLDMRLLALLASNLPDNSTVPDGDKVWLLDMEAEQYDPAVSGAGPGGRLQEGDLFMPESRNYRATLEVAVLNPSRPFEDIRGMLLRQVLNLQPTSREKVDPARMSVVDLVDDPAMLVDAAIVQEDDRAVLIARRYMDPNPNPGAQPQPKYRIQRITIVINPNPAPPPAPADGTAVPGAVDPTTGLPTPPVTGG